MVLRKLAFAIVLFLATLCLTISQAWAKEANVFVWKVWKGEALPCYLTGTIHLPMASESELPMVVKQAIASSSTFVMEADLGTLTPELLSRFIVEPDGNHLLETLPPPTWQKLVTFAKTKGFGEDSLPYLKPWFLSLMVSLPANQPKSILDSILRAEAEARQVPVKFLERPEEQLGQMDRVEAKESVAMLEEALEHPEKSARSLALIEADYRQGALEALEREVFDAEQMRKSPDFFKRTIDERNAKWLPVFKRYLEKGNHFIAVGLAHLIGPKGLILSLEKEGYRMERLPVR